jgi:hypothetical protein
MNDCTERSEGQEGMPSRHSMNDCVRTPREVRTKRTNTVNRLTVGRETT